MVGKVTVEAPAKAKKRAPGGSLRSSFSPERWSAKFSKAGLLTPGSSPRCAFPVRKPVANAARIPSYSGGGRVGFTPTSLFHPEPFGPRAPLKKSTWKRSEPSLSEGAGADKIKILLKPIPWAPEAAVTIPRCPRLMFQKPGFPQQNRTGL
jgi:hypothetical protein